MSPQACVPVSQAGLSSSCSLDMFGLSLPSLVVQAWCPASLHARPLGLAALDGRECVACSLEPSRRSQNRKSCGHCPCWLCSSLGALQEQAPPSQEPGHFPFPSAPEAVVARLGLAHTQAPSRGLVHGHPSASLCTGHCPEGLSPISHPTTFKPQPLNPNHIHENWGLELFVRNHVT